MAYPNEQSVTPAELPAGPDADPMWRQWIKPNPGSRRPLRRSLAVAFGAAAGIAMLGVPLGLVWSRLAPGVPVVDAGQAGTLVTDPAPEQYIAADGWFTLLGLGFGLLVTIAAWLVLRRDRGPFLLAGVVGGTLLAGRWVAPIVGQYPGHDAYEQWKATAAQGATYLAPPELQALGPKLVPAFVAAIVLTLLAGWSNDPDLDHPGALPGYAANHPGLGHPGAAPGYAADHSDLGHPGVPPGYATDHPHPLSPAKPTQPDISGKSDLRYEGESRPDARP